MKEISYFIGNARHLSSHLITSWDDYDFKEKKKDIKQRVPSIEFTGINDIEVEEKVSEYVHGFAFERFTRNYEVTFKDGRYLFEVTVTSHFGCVRRYDLTVYLMREEKKTRLFSERL